MIIAGILIGILIGTAIGWVAKPIPPGWVSQTEYDAMKSQRDTLNTNLQAALAELAALKKPKKVGLILATGGLGDKSFNDISYAGVVRARNELGIQFDYVEPKAIAEYEAFQTSFARTGEYAIIICIGYDQADALNKTAAAYPNQKFAIVDLVVDQPNVASLLFKANEGSFLVGVISAMTTTTKKVGFVGGMNIPLINDFYVGYRAGVIWANPNVTVMDPVYVGGWADPTKAKELATSLIELGADAIFVAAGKSGLGALDAIREKGKIGFGVDACQCYLYPGIKILASMTKRVDVAVYEMIVAAVIAKAYPNLTTSVFKGGIYEKGLKEGWTGCCRLPREEKLWETTFNFTHTALPANVLTKLLDAQNKILTGEINVPRPPGLT